MNAHDPGLAALQAEADALCLTPQLRELLHERWPELGGQGQAGSLQLRIHPGDQMLLHSLRHHRDANAAVSQYVNVALQQYRAARQILDTLLLPGDGPVEVLDFACGFGRLLRLLSCCDRELHLSASEIQDEALEFVAGTFGVEALPSSLRPEAFQPPARFDFIWVASLFSHLPEGLFHRWLKQLMGLLTPRGVLCFSVHDQALVPRDETLPASGLLFKPHSENADLDAEAYGTTYVSETFVRRAVAAAVGDDRAAWRIAKGLAHEQDIYVVAADQRRDLAVLHGFRRGAWGWVDERRVDGQTLVLSGWAASIDDGALPAVTVRVDGQTHACATGIRRRDVREAFGDDRLIDAGWSWRMALPAESRQPWVEVLATTERGECALLYAGWPGGRPATSGTHVYRREVDLTVRSSLSVLATLVSPGSRVLDLGTGSGALGRVLREQRQCRVDGLTLSPAEHAEAQDAYERLAVADLEDPSWADLFAEAAYDCIVCADVLEHLRGPEQVLRACHRLLKPGGSLLVSVPNVGYAGMVVDLMHGDWRYGPEGLLDRTHLRFFTRRSFSRLLHQEGWRVERVEPIELTWYYTEFHTPFDLLPPAVARYLCAQPDASVYQLVFAARRADEPARAADPLQLAATVAGDRGVHVAVYASTLVAVDSAGAQRRLSALGRVGADRQSVVFEIPADCVPRAGLLWHPADRPGYLHLHGLALRDRSGQMVWQWVSAPGAEAMLRRAPHRQLRFGMTAAADEALPLLLTGSEPAIELPVGDAGSAGGTSVGPWQLEVRCGWPLSADYRALQQALAAPPPPDDQTVEIVLPVHGGLDVARRCLTSLMAAHGRQPWHLTVIDDASPDPAVSTWLREVAALYPDVSVIANMRNLGFVATVNLGMRLAGRRDVVLLNSDTEVAGDWLDRLRQAAYRGPRVGTVTPFSNNATICSFPRFCEANALPAGQTVDALHALFARTHDGHSLEVPTAVGFCMYIRRDCLDETGEFDARSFGAGYGEENDFCLRASARGWTHLHALDAFVYHAGGVSFSDRQRSLQSAALETMRRLHPRYEDIVREFVSRDPARPYREAVERLLKESQAGCIS
jgi:GT2 family glycosyltransferase/2-polyprenyl-3-methyl-5-hydroxy-6-metoxy-1,4-benzoquinol methylase